MSQYFISIILDICDLFPLYLKPDPDLINSVGDLNLLYKAIVVIQNAVLAIMITKPINVSDIKNTLYQRKGS